MKLLNILTFAFGLLIGIAFATSASIRGDIANINGQAQTVKTLYLKAEVSIAGLAPVFAEQNKLNDIVQKTISDLRGERNPVTADDAHAISGLYDSAANAIVASTDHTVAIKPQLQKIGVVSQTLSGLHTANDVTKAFGAALIPKLPNGHKGVVQRAQGRIEAAQAKAIAAFS